MREVKRNKKEERQETGNKDETTGERRKCKQKHE